MRILLIEDDVETASFISQSLSGDGHHVETASDGSAGLGRALGANWDLLIVDRMLPVLDGLKLVRAFRERLVLTPVLFLTTLGGVDDRVAGLNAGADDYLVKPFAIVELLARVTALGRRSPRPTVETTMSIADLEVDLLTRTAKRGGALIELLPREFRLLEYLIRHREQIVTRTMLLEHVWDVHFEPNTTVVETHISRLRSKIDKGQAVPLIHTVRGAGYSLRVAV